MATSNKRIQMKDKGNNKLFPDIRSSNIPNNAVKYAQLDAELQSKIDGKADKATTLAGYGITDAYTKTEVDTTFTNLEKTLIYYEEVSA